MADKDNDLNFNMDTFNHYLNSDDDLDVETAQQTKQDFKDYYKTVIHFTERINAYKKEHSGDDYRQEVGRLDRRRRDIHNNCLSDIQMMNKMAEMDGLKPFLPRTDGKNRTDIGDAILQQGYEQMVKGTGNKTPVEDTSLNSVTQTRDLVNNYNKMLDGYTKYPIVKDGQSYRFMNMFTGKTPSDDTVKDYVKSRSNGDEKKMGLLSQAMSFVRDHTENLSKSISHEINGYQHSVQGLQL